MEAVCISAARAWSRSAKEGQPFRDRRSTRPMNGGPKQRSSGCVLDMAWEVGTMDEVQTKRSVIQRKTAEFRWELSNAIDCELGWLKDGDFRVLRVIFKYEKDFSTIKIFEKLSYVWNSWNRFFR